MEQTDEPVFSSSRGWKNSSPLPTLFFPSEEVRGEGPSLSPSSFDVGEGQEKSSSQLLRSEEQHPPVQLCPSGFGREPPRGGRLLIFLAIVVTVQYLSPRPSAPIADIPAAQGAGVAASR